MKRIENQIELVKEHPDLDLNSDEYTIELIKGLKNELEAHRIIKSEGIESAVKQAKSAVGSAIEFYNKAGREELKEGAIGRLIELEAIEAKLETDFGTAAGKHQRYVDELPNSDGADYHRTQVRVCRAKENLIGGKYREAQTELNEISKEVGYVHSRNRPLELLVRAAVDYENGNKTNSGSIYAQLYSDDNDEEHILNIEEDYSSGLTQVIAAQRFQELPIDEDITDFIVDHSIKNTLTSNAVDDISIETTSTGIPTEEVSMENLWRNRLPLNVHNKLQTAELNVQTSFDWDSSIETVMRALEIQMVAVVEYHSKREWGAEWESKIINGGPGNISLGDCFEFFRRHHQETAESLSCAEEVLRKDEEKIVNDISINSIRNILAHGNQLHVADTEQKYNDIHDAITELMRILTDVTPIPAKISKNLGFSNMYYLRLLQKSHNDTVIVSVESELSENDIYYLPPNSVDDNLKLELDDNSILICDYDKGLESVTV